MSTQSRIDRDVLRTVEVRSPNGQRTVFLEGITPATPLKEIRARALSELRLTEEVDWNVRDDRTGRLLHEDERLDDLAESGTQIKLTMQPDAGLGSRPK
jgi:hypothetical protein